MNNRIGGSSNLPQKLRNFCASNPYEFKVTASSVWSTGFVKTLSSINDNHVLVYYLNSLVFGRKDSLDIPKELIGGNE